MRDAYSKQVVEKCYARTPLSYPDVVFLYGKEKKTHDKNSKGKKVCCNVLSYDYYKNAGGSKSKEEYFDEWKEILDSYTDSDTIILFSSTTIWCCTIKVNIENSKGQYIEKDKQEATKDGSESTKIQHGI